MDKRKGRSFTVSDKIDIITERNSMLEHVDLALQVGSPHYTQL